MFQTKQDLNLCVFNMITGINESKTLTKYVSGQCKCKSDSRKYNSNQKSNNDKCQCQCKKHHICEKYYIWNPATCICKNGKYLASVIDHSVVTLDEIIDAGAKLYNKETKTVPTNFNWKNITILLALLSINYHCIIDTS